MAEKDIVEKALEDYNDVFADIVNVLLFEGQEIIAEDEPEDGEAASAPQPLYPVITMVLYFGKTPWVKNKTLKKCLRIPEKLVPYVSDYKINIFDIPRLTQEQVNRFKSDFKIVADYFVQITNNKDYVPTPDMVIHVDEILKMMRILTKDPRYEIIIDKTKQKSEEKITMCEVLDKVEARGIEKGRAEMRSVLDKIEARGIEKGREEGRKEERAAYAARESNYLSRIAELEARLAMKEGARSI